MCGNSAKVKKIKKPTLSVFDPRPRPTRVGAVTLKGKKRTLYNVFDEGPSLAEAREVCYDNKLLHTCLTNRLPKFSSSEA